MPNCRLNSFIGKTLRENLFLIDIVCHGVPSPYIWRDYLKYQEGKYKQNIVSVNFRDKKEFGWWKHLETFTLKDGRKIIPQYNPFTTLFHQQIMLRESCGKCPFCNIIRPSDITIADFWGWEKVAPKFNQDNKGVSLLLLNTSKGKRLFNSIKDQLHLINAKIEDCLQPNLQYPTKLNPESEKFRTLYIKYGFVYILKKYTNIGLKNRIQLYAKRIKVKLRQL